MAVSVNKTGERFAATLIDGGHYDTDSSWSFSAEDGDKLLGSGGNDWDNYAKWHLGEDTSADAKTKERYKYPFGKDGKVYKHALDAIDSRATQNKDEDVDAAAKRLKDALAKKEKDKEGEGEQSVTVTVAPRGAALSAVIERAIADGILDRHMRKFSASELEERGVIATMPRADGLEVRHATIARMQPDTFDDSDNSVDCVFSTGAPVPRYDWQQGRDYVETLTIDPKAVRLDRMNGGSAPVLDSHNYWGGLSSQLGAVVPGSVRVEGGQLRGKVKFSRVPNSPGAAAAQDVKDGVVRSLSVGYVTHKQEIDETVSPPVYRATDWEPYEVSAVSMPADPGAGFRSHPVHTPRALPPASQGRDHMAKENGGGTSAELTPEELTTQRAALIAAETSRVSGIQDLGRRFKLPDAEVNGYINSGEAIDSVRTKVLDGISANTVRISPVLAPGIIGVRKTVEMKPGIMAARLVRLFAAAKGDPDRARDLAKSSAWDDGHRDAVLVAIDRGMDFGKRALVAGIGSSGGFMVAEEYSDEVIDLLRHRAVIRKLGARSIPLPGGNLSQPRLSSGATATYVGEAVSSNASQEALQQLKWSSKTLMALVPISNDLLKFASPAADQMVLDDMVKQIAVAEDSYFIRGLGTAFSPRGVRYAMASGNVLNSAGTSLANMVTDLEDLESQLEQNDVPMINPAWIMNPRSKNSLKFAQTTTGAFLFREEMQDGMLMDYPYAFTNNVPANLGGGANQAEVYFLDMSEVVIADVPGLEIEISTEAAYVDSTGTLQAAFSQNVTVMKAVERHDINLLHDVSAACISNAQW